MKKIYFLLFSIVSFFCYSQPYSILLKQVDWTITKIEWAGIPYYPPAPLTDSGKIAFNFDNNNGFKTTFFNTAGGKVTFGLNNAPYFSVWDIAVTLAEYGGENQVAVRQFDDMATGFYFGYQPTDEFYFDYEEIISGRNLIVTNSAGNKIFYSNLILKNKEVSLNKEISIYPNPPKDEFYLKSVNKNSDKINVEIYDRSGKLVSRQNVSSAGSINIKSLPTGTYVVKFGDLKSQVTSKLIVKK